MRKWVRIPAVLLLVVVAIVVPKSETAVHKQRCQAAWDSLTGRSLTARIRRFVGLAPSDEGDQAKLDSSREALVDVGYLVRKRFVLRNMSFAAMPVFYKIYPETAFVCVEYEWNNNLVIIAPPSEMAAISNIVARIDERTR